MRLKGIIEYKSGDTLDCYYHGCELYFQIKSKSNKNKLNLKKEDLIPITFTLSDEEYYLKINTEKIINLQEKKAGRYKFKCKEEEIKEGKILAVSTTPMDYFKPVFIFISEKPSLVLERRNFTSQKLGINSIFFNKSYVENNKLLHIDFYSLVNTTATIKISLLNEICLETYKEKKIRLKLQDVMDLNIISFSYNKTKDKKQKKILLYSLGENIKQFNMKVEFTPIEGNETVSFKVRQRFENGYSAIIDFNDDVFNEIYNSKIHIILSSNEIKYKNKNIEIGYEIIDGNKEDIREVNIMEHIYGVTEKSETCYKIKDKDISELNKAIMRINIFSQPLEFNIKNSNNEKLYSLDIYNNYFIRFPNISGNYFCFKYVTPKETEIEIFGEISYDFQIYFENELYKYQMFIMPLFNGKIYIHSLNKGDVIIYRHNYYDNNLENNEKIIYSANMVKIRGNPKLYGYSCRYYPNSCNVNINDLNGVGFDRIESLNIYNINKKLNIVKDIDVNGESVYEQRKQYLTIVSCESGDDSINNGECKYAIEINNERDVIQLIPEIVFATGIYNPINYFLIKISDYKSIKLYLKIYFTVLVGNAELFLYEDSNYQNEIKSYKFSHAYRKNIIEISENFLENYYIIIKCEDKSFIELKYETDKHYKGYNNLIPNEINFEPINKNSKSYYNMHNPNYHVPFNDKNNNFYYKVLSMDCSMSCGDVNQKHQNLTEFNFEIEKNKLNYLSSYGFYSKVDNFLHDSYNDENCRLIIYNGEKSKNVPLFVNAEMSHLANDSVNFYVFPFLYDRDTSKGIIIEVNVYDIKDLDSSDSLYTLAYYVKPDSVTYQYPKKSNHFSYHLSPYSFEHIFGYENIFGVLHIQLIKEFPNKRYYSTINFITSSKTPEYISANQTFILEIYSYSGRYFYSQINKNKKGYIKLNFTDTLKYNVTIFKNYQKK